MKVQKTGLGLPTSGQILGEIVAALNIRDEVLTSRTAKRYFSGKIISENRMKAIYLALGDLLIGDGIIPVPPIDSKNDADFRPIVATTCARICVKWDALRSTMQNRSASILEPEHAAEQFMRLVAVDLALRLFAILRLCKLEPPLPETPQWALENGFGLKLRKLIAECGLTRDQFAARLGVWDTSVDNWLDGNVLPTEENVSKIAGTISDFDKRYAESDLYVELRRDYSLSYLSNILATAIGRESVVEIATALYRFTYLITEDVHQMGRPPIEEVAGMEFDMFRLGSDDPEARILLSNLVIVEQDTEWREDILSASEPWDVRFQWIANESSQGRLAAGLAQDITDLPDARHDTNLSESPSPDDPASEEIRNLENDTKKTFRRLSHGNPILMTRRMIDAVHQDILGLRLIAQRYPTSAQAHAELGSRLGWAGSKMFRDRSMIDEAITECKIAAILREGWDVPLVEPAIFLTNAGYYEEALEELKWAKSRLPEKTPHFAYVNGAVLTELDRFSEALDEFEFVLVHRPDYAIAFNDAAHSAFMLGDKTKGIRYAKEARKFGCTQAYQNWRNRLYPKP